MVNPLRVLVCPGLLETLAKFFGAAGNKAFKREDF